MTCEFFNKQLMQMVELKMNMIMDENPNFTISPDRNVNHTLTEK